MPSLTEVKEYLNLSVSELLACAERNGEGTFSKQNAFSVSGYSGHGVALSVLSGKIIAELINGNSKRFDFMNKIPTKPFPGNSSLQWPMLVLGMLWYSLRDRLR